jgi:hypothetical protein
MASASAGAVDGAGDWAGDWAGDGAGDGARRLVAGRYLIDPSRPLPDCGGQLAFAASETGRPASLMAVLSRPDALPRSALLSRLTGIAIPGLLGPLGHGPVKLPEPGYAVISPAPPGRSLAATLRPWPDAALLALVLRPAGQVLDALQARGATHRAIRPDNVFQAAPNQPVVLGAAWAAPAASRQPALFEPPYVAICPPAARGEGTIADDVYALGVLLVTLALGRAPMEGLDETEIIRRKLDLGSFAAIVGEARLPSAVGELARSMLAEDPEHRPAPALLADQSAARARRVAARPPRLAQRSLEVAGQSAWNLRGLAATLAASPAQGVRLLRGGMVEYWLRRTLGDTNAATRVEELVRQRAADAAPDDPRADAMLLMRVIAVVDPLAPLCWRGILLWPDALGPAIAAASGTPELLAGLEDLVQNEAIAAWAAMRAERIDPVRLRGEARQFRAWLRLRGPSGGIGRLAHALNPAMPCRGALLAGAWVSELRELLPALEAAAAREPAGPVLDLATAAFIAARSAERLDAELSAYDPADPAALARLELDTLARLQQRLHPGPLPALAARVAASCAALVAQRRHRPGRAALQARLDEVARTGDLVAMLRLLDDPAGTAADEGGAARAAAAAARIDAELAAIAAGAAGRAREARRIGHEISAGIGLLAVTAALLLTMAG